MSGTMTLYGRAPAGLRNLGSDADDAITLGRLVHSDGSIGHRIRLGEPLPVLGMGPNGSGKGTCFLATNILQCDGATLVVVDPKGEQAAITAPYRRTLGPVYILNACDVLTNIPGYEDLKSDGYNPYVQLDPASPSFNVQASLLAEAIVPITGRDPHWDESARSQVSAFVMYTVLEAQRLGIVPTMARTRELLCEASFAPTESNNFEGVGIPQRALEMMKSGIPGLANKASQFVDWNRETQSIASTSRRHSESFDDPEIADDLAKGTFDMRELKRGPGVKTLYIILPPEMMERHAKWLRLVLTSAIHACLRARRPGEPKVIFFIDEFHALGRLDLITNVWALTRGYGVQIVPVLQDLNQLKRLYPDMWETFIGMAGAVLSFAPNDITTAEWMAARAGFTTRQAASINESFSKSITDSGGHSSGVNGSSNSGWSVSNTSSTNTSSAPVKVPLMSAHQMYGLQPGYLMVALNGLQNVVPAYAPAYYQIRECIARARANPYYWR